MSSRLSQPQALCKRSDEVKCKVREFLNNRVLVFLQGSGGSGGNKLRCNVYGNGNWP